MPAAVRLRYTLVAGITAVVIGGGFTAVGLTRHAGAGTAVPSAADAPLSADTPATDEPLLFDESAEPSVPPSVTPSPSATSASPKPSATKAPVTTKKPAATKTSAKATSAPKTGDAILDGVLSHINAARVDEGLSVLTLDANLSKAAALHTQLMIDGCGLDHQCSGESGIGTRFSAQGVKWSQAAENIGYGSSGAGDAQIIKAANGLTDSMLAETPPNDGHRKNLLNASLKRIGLSVIRDSSGRTWMTQDFVN
jgi:uncharacterized protein YkwD